MSWGNLNPRTRERLRLTVLARDNGICQIRLTGCTHVATQADHINPRETHGDGPDNLRAACASCNNRRGQPGRGDPQPNPSTW